GRQRREENPLRLPPPPPRLHPPQGRQTAPRPRRGGGGLRREARHTPDVRPPVIGRREKGGLPTANETRGRGRPATGPPRGGGGGAETAPAGGEGDEGVFDDPADGLRPGEWHRAVRGVARRPWARDVGVRHWQAGVDEAEPGGGAGPEQEPVAQPRVRSGPAG